MRLHRLQATGRLLGTQRALAVAACLLAAAMLLWVSSSAQAAITWDSQLHGDDPDTVEIEDEPFGAETQWWFDPVNWGHTNPGEAGPYYLPPTNADATAATDVVINATDTPLPGGEGVVFDPGSDPFYGDVNGPELGDDGAQDLVYPTNYDAHTIWRMYLARSPVGEMNTEEAVLTIRGNLQTHDAAGTTQWQIGRTSGTADLAANARIVQKSGIVKNNFGDIDLGSNDSNQGVNFLGNGTYDYWGGTLEQGINSNPSTARLRLSAGGSTGVGGIGTFIMRNPGEASGGYVRVEDMYVAAFGGQNGLEPNGTTTGVGIVEFHATAEGTRPVQVLNNLQLANGGDFGIADTGVRSSQLRLVLDEAPMVNMSGIPLNMGLFDTDSDELGGGSITVPAAGANDFGATFSNADAPNPLLASATYDQGDIVTAMFGLSTYRWTISYTGDITWTDKNTSDLLSVAGTGGNDIVLIGLDSIIVPEGLAGDYNENDVIDAADYTVWRDALTAGSTTLANDPTPGVVNESDFTYWRNHFGETMGSGAGSASAAIPEPGSLVLGVLAVAGLLGFRRRS